MTLLVLECTSITSINTNITFKICYCFEIKSELEKELKNVITMIQVVKVIEGIINIYPYCLTELN